MVWPVQCVPVRGRDSLVPVLPDRGSVFGFSGFTLAHVSFGIPRLACCCLPLEDCGCVVRSGSAPLITPLANLFQPCRLTLAGFAPFPACVFFLLHTLTHSFVFIKYPPSFQAYSGSAPYLPPLCLLSFCHPQWIIITVIKKEQAALRPPLLHRQIW